MICVKTIRRSGTHLFAAALEEILGEYVNFFPDRGHYLQDPPGAALRDLEKGHVKFSHKHYRIDIRHPNPSKGMKGIDRRVRRVIQTVRTPLELIDSKFRLHLYHRTVLFINGTQGYFHLKKGYTKEPIYREFIRYFLELEWYNVLGLLERGFPTIFVSYNDFLEDPTDALCDMFSFIDRLSCQVSYALPAIQYLKEKTT